MKPEHLDKCFSVDKQRNYVSMLVKRGGLTRRRAECFVRLWAYLLLKERYELEKRLMQSLTELHPPQGWVSCTHREAAEIFYADHDRGSDRAAGMMIDQLVALGLLKKQFDGQSTCFQILPWDLVEPSKPVEPVKLVIDDFNPRTDAVPVTDLMVRNYAQLTKDNFVDSHKTVKALRSWACEYSKGMRVLRRTDNLTPVGFYLLYPTSGESERNFFISPAKTRFFTSDTESDPFKLATPGDLDCTCVYLRMWMIDHPYMQQDIVCQLVIDVQKTLVKMQADFPNLCDLYGIAIAPIYIELRLALGFEKIGDSQQRSMYWFYQAIERFIALDVKQAISNVKFQIPAEV